MNAVLSITTKTDAEIAHSTDVLAAELEELRGLYVTFAEDALCEVETARYEGIAQGAEVALSWVLSALGIEVGA